MTQRNTSTADGPIILDLPATLEATSAVAFIAELSKLPATAAIGLNAAAVTAISPGYLQILISAFKTFPRLAVCDASSAFAEAFAGWGIAYPQAAPAVALTVAAAPSVAPGGETECAGSIPAEAFDPPADEVSDGGPPLALEEPVAKTILTIDDSRTMRDMLNMTLSEAGFVVVQAVDGVDGLNALARQPVDVVITDINMPKLDGFGVIRAIRKDPAYDSTPILVLSTEAEQESKDIAKDAGATGWIVKPFDPVGLVEIVNSVCG